MDFPLCTVNVVRFRTHGRAIGDPCTALSARDATDLAELCLSCNAIQALQKPRTFAVRLLTNWPASTAIGQRHAVCGLQLTGDTSLSPIWIKLATRGCLDQLFNATTEMRLLLAEGN